MLIGRHIADEKKGSVLGRYYSINYY